jgi:hypothetical protein
LFSKNIYFLKLIFSVFLDYFNVLMLKINLKNKKKYYFDASSSKKHVEK